MGKLACASLSSLDRSTTRRNVDRTYREKVERKEGEETLLLPSYSLAAYVALSKSPRWMKTGEIKGRTDGAVHCEEVLAARED